MSLLALETSGEICSVALAANDSPPLQRSFRHEMRLLRNLTSEVNALLWSAGLRLSDLAGIAVNVGPGSYTGLRISVTTAKVWALALNLPIWGVSGLQAQAWYASDGVTDPILSVLPARRGHVYAAVYKQIKSMPPMTLLEPGLYEETRLPDLLPPKLEAVVGPDVSIIEGLGVRVGRVHQGTLDAVAIALIAERRQQQDDADVPLTLAPLYLAEPHITTPRGASYGS